MYHRGDSNTRFPPQRPAILFQRGCRDRAVRRSGYDLPQGLDADGRAVWTALQAGELDFDALCEKTGIEAQELGALLTMMEMDGHVESRPGLRYALAAQGE